VCEQQLDEPYIGSAAWKGRIGESRFLNRFGSGPETKEIREKNPHRGKRDEADKTNRRSGNIKK